MSTMSSSFLWVDTGLLPGLLLSSMGWTSLSASGRPAGHPSRTAPTYLPWLSPMLVSTRRLPVEFGGIVGWRPRLRLNILGRYGRSSIMVKYSESKPTAMQGIARRSASVMLMAIMVAGGMTIAFPEAVPEAMAAPRSLANLGVSTTMFGGPMVVEIIVKDPNIDDTGIEQGAPDVTFDGNDLVMIQGDDGYWYAYIARDQMVQALENWFEPDYNGPSNTDTRLGTGLDYGTICTEEQRNAIIPGKEFAATNVYVANYTCGSPSGQTADQSLNVMNVLRSAKIPSTPGGTAGDSGENIGNNGMSSLAYWPFIQTFDDISDDSQLKVIYNKGGSPQEITIRYESDMDDLASLTLDREDYPHNSFVHLTLNEALFNIDPTDIDVWSWFNGESSSLKYPHYYLFDSNRNEQLTGPSAESEVFEFADDAMDSLTLKPEILAQIDFGTSGPLTFDENFGSDMPIRPLNPTPRDNQLNRPANNPLGLPSTGNGLREVGSQSPVITIKETGPNTGVFTNTDGNSRSDLITGLPERIGREVPFSLTYADTAQNWFVGYTTASVNMDEASVGADWSSGEEITISVTDQDLNRNSLVEEDLVITADNPNLFRILAGSDPVLETAYPVFFEGPGTNRVLGVDGIISFNEGSNDFEGFSPLDLRVEVGGARQSADVLNEGDKPDKALYGIFHLDVFGAGTEYRLRGSDAAKPYTEWLPANENIMRLDTAPARTNHQDMTGDLFIEIRNTFDGFQAQRVTIQMILWVYDISDTIYQAESRLDPLTIGNLGATLSETSPNSGVFEGTIEYIMLNQLNTVFGGAPNPATAAMATGLTEDTVIIVNGDYIDEDAIRIDYLDTDKQGQTKIASDKVDAPTHSGSVSLDQDSYKRDDTVIITLNDADLNVNNELRDVYTAITNVNDNNRDTISRAGQIYANNAEQGLLLEATFDDDRWVSCTGSTNPGFGTLIGSIRETAPTSGIFVADFQIPPRYCTPDEANEPEEPKTTLGKDLEVAYHDFFDSAGEFNEVGDVAGITSFTGSVSLDRSVYPVPFAPLDARNEAAAEGTPSNFRFHETFRDSTAATDAATRYIDDLGNVMIHVQINDKDLDEAGSGTDTIENAGDVLEVIISRDNHRSVPASASGERYMEMDIRETSPTSGIFELDLPITWQDGPAEGCPPAGFPPAVTPDVFPAIPGTTAEDVEARGDFDRRCLLQGDIITVTYTDESDATGHTNTVTDSATFDLRNGVLQSDKSVYIIGSDMILTLIDPDLDLDNDGKQAYSLDIIEWDSDAATVTMGPSGERDAFDPEPATLQETGDSTGIFQTIVEIPEAIQDEDLDRGEEIVLEYTDWGPSGADFVGDEHQDISLTVYTSNFGATIELDQKVYTWTDKVFITIVAPDHNFDSSLIDEIGRDATDPLQVATQEGRIDNYRLAETGPDTGIFTGEVILTGVRLQDKRRHYGHAEGPGRRRPDRRRPARHRR